MFHYWSLDSVYLTGSWLTIGSFDRVHLGHQMLVREMVEGAHAAGKPAVVLTFYPHPSEVLGKRKVPGYLTAPEIRAALLHKLGVDYVVTHPFNLQVAATEAQDFMRWVHQHLQLEKLWVGYDFALGKDRKGNPETLKQIGSELGYEVEVISARQAAGEIISSSRIRAALAAGDALLAAELLGRPYSFEGRVIHGDGRGKTIGVPTANLDIWSGQVLPKPGVYACHVKVGGQTWGAVTNVGYRPTFDNQPATPRVEAHLLDFNSEIYGQQVEIAFLRFLRSEQRFASVEALVEQIQADIQLGRALLQQS